MRAKFFMALFGLFWLFGALVYVLAALIDHRKDNGFGLILHIGSAVGCLGLVFLCGQFICRKEQQPSGIEPKAK